MATSANVTTSRVDHAVTAAPLYGAHLASSPKNLANWSSRSRALVDTRANTDLFLFSYGFSLYVLLILFLSPFSCHTTLCILRTNNCTHQSKATCLRVTWFLAEQCCPAVRKYMLHVGDICGHSGVTSFTERAQMLGTGEERPFMPALASLSCYP